MDGLHSITNSAHDNLELVLEPAYDPPLENPIPLN